MAKSGAEESESPMAAWAGWENALLAAQHLNSPYFSALFCVSSPSPSPLGSRLATTEAWGRVP